MAKGSSKTPKKNKKVKKRSLNETDQPEPPPPPPPTAERIKEIRKITITLESYENLRNTYTFSDIRTTLTYLGETVGETTAIPITDDKFLQVNETFSFEFDSNSNTDLDQLISSPVIFTVIQQPGVLEEDIVNQLKDIKTVAPTKSFDSAVSMYEAMTGGKVERVKGIKEATPKEKTPNKGSKEKTSRSTLSRSTKGSKETRGSKSSNDTRRTSKLSAKKPEGPPVVYGICTLDLMPLFYGTETFSESLILYPIEYFQDDRMVAYKLKPKLLLTVSISECLTFDCKPVIMNVTLESVYNLPSVMKPQMEYKVCSILPNKNSLEPMCFTSPKYTIAKNEEQMKCWNGIQKIGDNANTTRYKIDFNPDDIKNSTDTDLAPGFVETNPRLEFNYLKRNYLLSDGQILLGYQFSKNRRILVEFFMMNKSEKLGSREETRTKGGKKKNNKESKSGTSKATEQPATEPKKPKAYLHLMAIVDVSTLLYPGVTRTRVATKLRTYHAKEAFIQTGAEDSFFMPKPIEKSQSPSKESTTATAAEGDAKPKKEKKSKGSKKSSKKSAKSDKDKSSKKSGKSKKSGVSGTGKGKSESGKNLKTLLPTKPEPEPEEEPSTEVYNEDGKPCYIILEIELSEPINKKRPMEDLEEDLQSLLQSQPKTSKVMLTPCLCKDYFQESLNEILQDMYTSYGEYMQKIKHCDCSNQIEFFDYLRKTGIYQSYITSLTSAATAMITSQYRPEGELDKGSKQYRDLIEEVFIYLVSQMNFVLNKQTCTSFRPITRGPQKSLGLLLFYAREATELGNQKQADKYYMERLCNHETQPDFWFDYAVYKLEMQDPDTAFQCIYQALIYNMYHPLCLLLYGILLADFKRRDEAETCFLNLLEQHPRWLEAWAILFLFYYNYENFEGMEVALAECKKYLEDDRCYRNYFTASEDLAWTDKICPNSIFFRAASLLLKLRVYNWVENALAQELTKHYGITNYLMGAVCYYKKMYTHALEHLAVAKFHHGSDYAVASLTGHCLLAMDKLEEAKEEYYHILESYNRPEDMHLVYVNTSLILEQFDDIQESKKVILIACKNNPSPYTWWKAGALFYHLNDLLSAENCFSESNLRDNSLAEVWAYLTLINLKLQHLSEAELCYQQTTKNNLLDEELKYEIRMEYEKLKSVHPKFLCF